MGLLQNIEHIADACHLLIAAMQREAAAAAAKMQASLRALRQPLKALPVTSSGIQ